MHQTRDRLRQRRPVHVVRNLRDDDLLLAALQLLRVAGSAHFHDAAARPQVALNPVPSRNHPARREVRPRHHLHQLIHRHLRVVNDRAHRVYQLAQVVRWDVRRHAHGDARRAVHQQIRQRARQHRRLGGLFIIIGSKIHRVLVNAHQQPLRDLRQAALRVTVGCGRIVVHGAKISLRVHQRVTQHPVLRHAHQRVVNRAVAVRMVGLQHFADDPRALRRRPVVQQPFPQHRIQHPPLHGLQPVAGIRQRARNDDRH